MRRAAPQMARPAEGKLDQGLTACGFPKKSAQNDIREHDVHDYMHETPKETGRIVY